MSPSPSTIGAAPRLARQFFRLLSALAALELGAAASTASADSTDDTVLALSAKCVSGGNSFAYFRVSHADFLIERGDVLEYDVYVDGSSPLPRGGVDILCAGGATLRDSGALDSEGRSAHGDADLSAALDRWIHRRIALEALVGRVATRFVIGCEGDVPGTYAQYVDNIVISNAAGERRALFRNEPSDTLETESSKGYDAIDSFVSLAPRRERYPRGRVPFIVGHAGGSPEGKGPSFRNVDLAPLRDRRGVAAAEDGTGADFDGSGHAFPCGELPGEPTILSAVPFDLPPPSASLDHVSAHGQMIDLRGVAPGATFLASFLAASRSSTFETSLAFIDEGGDASLVPIRAPSWIEPEAGTSVFEFSHRASGSGRVLGPTRLAIVTVPVALKTAAAALRLPETPDLRIFALTLRPLAPTEIDDDFRLGWIAHTVRTPETADYLRNYRFARLLPEFQAEEGRLRRLYDLAVASDGAAFRTTVLERLSRFSEVGAVHKTLTTRLAAWLDLSRPPRTGASEAVDRATDALHALAASDDVYCAVSGIAAFDAIAAANPQLLAELKRYALSKRLEFASVAWALPRPCRAGGETLVRNLLEGQRFLADKFGATGRVVALLAEDDLPPTLPQILRKSGVDYVVFLPATGDGAVAEAVRSGFAVRWEGIDGSRVFGVGPAGHPEGAFSGETVLAAALGLERRLGLKDSLVLFGAATDSEDNVGAARDASQSRLMPRVRFDRVESFCDAIASQRDVELPLTKGEPFETTATGGGVRPLSSTISRARSAEAALVAAESLRATIPGDDARDLQAAWRALLVAVAGDPTEADLAPADAEARAALATAVARVARSADTRCGAAPAASVVVVVNPLGFAREESVEVTLPSDDEPHRIVTEDGTEIALQTIAGGNDKALVSVSTPAFSSRVLRIFPAGAGAGETPQEIEGGGALAETNRLENRFVRVAIDADSGRIVSLVDKSTGRETLGGAPGGGLAGTLLVAGAGSEPARLVGASVLEPGPVRAAIALEFATSSGPTLRQVLRLEAGSPRLSIEIDWTGRQKGESAAMKFPVAGAGPFATTVEAPFGAIERPFPLPGSAWIDVADPTGSGIAVFAGRGAAIGIADAGSIAVTADERALFAVLPHGAPGGWRTAFPARNAAALLVPLIAVTEAAHDGARRTGPAGVAPAFLEASGSEGSLVEGLRRSADGASIVVRLREAHGAPADALLRFAFPVGEALEADLLERPTGRAFPAQGVEVPVGLAPFEIQTVLVRPAK